MIREVQRADGSVRFEVYGHRDGKKVYVSSHDNMNDAHIADVQFRCRIKKAEGAVVAFKMYAVHANGAESLLLHDSFADEHRTYDVEINDTYRGIWIAPLPTATDSQQRSTLPTDLNADDMREWWHTGKVRGVDVQSFGDYSNGLKHPNGKVPF